MTKLYDPTGYKIFGKPRAYFQPLKGPRAVTQRVADWLNTLDLGRYAQAFSENGIDFSILPDLTDQDLQKLGVLVGHRRKLLRMIAELKDAAPRGRSKPVRTSDAAERRHLTLLFGHLEGSTELSAQVDPEDLRSIDPGLSWRLCPRGEPIRRFARSVYG